MKFISERSLLPAAETEQIIKGEGEREEEDMRHTG
jgi:hypothetical protein